MPNITMRPVPLTVEAERKLDRQMGGWLRYLPEARMWFVGEYLLNAEWQELWAET
jgi:hypothetical protein